MAEFPEIKSKHSLVAKHVTKENGTNSQALSPRPLDSLWQRLLPSLLNSTTNIAVSMLVMKILTLTLLMYLTHSSANTTASPLDSNMFPTWTSTKSRETLPMMSQFTPSEFVLDDPSEDSVCPLESPSNNVLTWKSSWVELSQSSLVILLATTIH